jgi:hypothetical protein
MPQVVFEPLPIFERGEGLDSNDTINEGITINYVDADNSWTLVQKRKKKRTKQGVLDKKWNAQQKENFLRFGDIYRESYKNYRNVDVGPPVANIPLQQPVAQPPVIIQGIPPPPAVPAPVQPPPVVAGAHLPPVIIITPPPKPAAQIGQEYPRLEAIPEEEEENEPQPQGAGYRSPSSSSSSSSSTSDDTLTAEDFDTAPNTPASRPKDPESPFGAKGDNLLAEF